MKLTDLLEAARDQGGGEILAPRMIRFLTAEGVLSAPSGKTKNAEYTEDHLAELVRYLRLSQAGYPLAAIKMLASSREIAPGVLLVVYSAQMDRATDPSAVADRVKEILTDMITENTDADHNPSAH